MPLRPRSIRFLFAARAARLRVAVVSSSANAAAILGAAGLAGAFDAVIDGGTVVRQGLRSPGEFADECLRGGRRGGWAS